MLLVGLNFTTVLLGLLYASIAVIVLVIAYRKLLGRLGKGAVSTDAFIEVHTPEYDSDKKVLTFYFVAKEPKEYKLSLQDLSYSHLMVVDEGQTKVGGNIVRLNNDKIQSGTYFLCFETDNQKTTKKFQF